MVNENKVRFQLWIEPKLMEEVDAVYQKDSKSKSEFITKAIRSYLGYVELQNTQSFLPNYLLSTMKALITESDTRHSRLMFKLAVELAMVQNLLAAEMDLDADTMQALRESCIKELRQINGILHMEDAIRWQAD